MAQLRQDYDKFAETNTEIVVIGPDKPKAFIEYFSKENLPFIGLSDPDHSVLKLYGQKVNLFKLGRMPAQMIVDSKGYLRYIHYGHDMTDIPENEEVLAILKEISDDSEGVS